MNTPRTDYAYNETCRDCKQPYLVTGAVGQRRCPTCAHLHSRAETRRNMLRYYERDGQGLCVSCGGKRYRGKYCKRHYKMNREGCRNYYEKQKLLGRCVRCRRKLPQGYELAACGVCLGALKAAKLKRAA